MQPLENSICKDTHLIKQKLFSWDLSLCAHPNQLQTKSSQLLVYTITKQFFLCISKSPQSISLGEQPLNCYISINLNNIIYYSIYRWFGTAVRSHFLPVRVLFNWCATVISFPSLLAFVTGGLCSW